MRHFADDTDLLERVALGKVPPGERAAIEEHLAGCEDCRKAVEHERAIAGGVRSFAREQLKNRLKSGLRTSEQKLPWPRVLSAAAMILIVVGLGLYNEWWISPPPPVGEQVGPVELKPEREKPIDLQAAPPEPRRADEPRAGVISRDESVLSELRTGAADSDAMKDARAPAPAAAGDEPSAEESAPKEMDEDEVIWILGSLQQKTAAFGAMKSVSGAQVRKAEAPEERLEQVGESTQLIAVSQQPLRRVPPDQSALVRGGGIPTSVETKDGVLELTVYSDTLTLSDQGVRVEQVTDDSLIIVVGDTYVAYKIPGGWGRGKGRKALKLKE